MRSLTLRVVTPVVAAVAAVGLAAGCSSSPNASDPAASSSPAPTETGPVTLTSWTWAPNMEKVVAIWNKANPDITVKVSQPAQGDALATKLLTASKAGNPPDLAQAEYQALPSLVVADAVADITADVAPAKDKFSEATWNLTSFGGKTYGVPQDVGPMALFYRADLFKQYGLPVPTTWDEYAAAARTLRQKDPSKYLTTFSSHDPGWFAGLSQQAGAAWWQTDGTTWKVGQNDAATKKVASYWGDLVDSGDVLGQPMYTPAWNKQLNDGTLLGWPTAVWGAGVLEGIAPDTKGKWALAPLPTWDAGQPATGYWGGSSTAVMKGSKHKAAATEFATWLNSDPAGVDALITISSLYPAATAGQTSPALSKPPAFMPNQPTYFADVAEIAATAKGFTWGPNTNVAYAAYKDAYSEAIQSKQPFDTAADAMQQATVADMKKAGYEVGEG
jgi:multiple sugar transport system substrate-binding protein